MRRSLSWGAIGSKEALLFLKKKKQKNFLTLLPREIGEAHIYCFALPLANVPGCQTDKKFFASFFQKRSASFSSTPNGSRAKIRCRTTIRLIACRRASSSRVASHAIAAADVT